MNKIIYLDHAATTRMNEQVLKEMLPFFSLEYGNPSSIYSIGRSAKRAIESSRRKVARVINAKVHEIFFTSGGSESDNLAIKGIAYNLKEKGNHIITTKIEHPAVLNTCHRLEKEGFKITYLNVDDKGLISLEELKNNITEKTILISIMYANNEIGTIEPIKKIGDIAKEHGIYFHTDAVQAIGNVKIDVEAMNIDLLSMSGHKFYGPKGIGVLYVRQGVELSKIQDGGHQERDLRAGTENVPGIVGIGKAIELAYENFEEKTNKLKELKKYCIEKLKENFNNIRINGDKENRLPGNVNVSFSKISGEELLLILDEKGICTSAGSACSSGTGKPSHVLVAIGLSDELANSSLRITLGNENTKEDIEYLIDCLKEIKKLRV
ncbi:MAG: cysteine desulfurase NifS [Clostridiales bacterium]|nr:cysteine desulfurase NifS [Clostridiales bacterium]